VKILPRAYVSHLCFQMLLLISVLTAGLHAQKGQDLWAEFVVNPYDHPQIPNNSYAGYMRGELPVPDVAVVVDATDPGFGAVAVAGFDNTQAVQAAIDHAGRNGGGAVYLPAGTYEFDGMLFIEYSGVVLRGAGKGQTILQFNNDIKDIFNIVGYSGSPYSWTGGHIWIAPRDLFRRDDRTKINFTTEMALNNDPHTWEWAQPGEMLTTVTGEAFRGEFSFTVAEASDLRPGDLIYLAWEQSSDDSFLKELAEFSQWEFNTETDWQNTFTSTHPADYYSDRWITPTRFNWYQWPVEIAAVNGTTVTLRQPLRVDITNGTSGPDRNVMVMDRGDMLSGVGVEDLTILGFNRADYSLPDWQIGFTDGWNGVYMLRNYNSWIRNVEAVDCHLAVIVDSSKNVTVSGIDMRNPINRSVHNVVDVKLESADCMVEDVRFIVEPGTSGEYYGHGGLETEYFSSGLVFRNNALGWGTFDYHRALPFDILHTDTVLTNNTGTPGGNGRAGPMAGRRCVHWNVAATVGTWVNMPKQLPSGALVGMQAPLDTSFDIQRGVIDGDKGTVTADAGVIPAITDLYQAQLDLRLGGETSGSVVIVTPANDALFTNKKASVSVRVEAAAFGLDEIDTVRIYLNGVEAASGSSETLTHAFTYLPSGRHELFAELTLVSGEVIAGNRVAFVHGVSWQRIDDRDPRIASTGMVEVDPFTEAYYSSTYSYDAGDAVADTLSRTGNFNAPSGSVTIPFNGIRARVLVAGVVGSGYRATGEIGYRVYLDDMTQPVEEGVLDFRSPYRHRVVPFDSGFVSPGNHTLRFEFYMAETNDRGYYYFDALEVLSLDDGSTDLFVSRSSTSAGHVNVQWHGQLGFAYQLQVSSDLVEWNPYGDWTNGEDVPVNRDIPLGEGGKRFFRLDWESIP
jgi:hypothetical protein